MFLKDRNLYKAVLLFFENNYQSSKEMFEKAMDSDRKNFIPYFYLGEIAEEQNLNSVDFFNKAQK